MTYPEGVSHVSVMPKEVMHYLALPAAGVAIDGTLGMAGHAALMAEALGDKGHLIGIDRDSASLAKAKQRLTGFGLRVDLLQGNFKDIKTLLALAKEEAVDGIVLDLGISSFQLDDPARGFTFKDEGPLDMRMDTTQGQSAEDFVNTASEKDLAGIIEDYGEDRFAKRIAKAIVFNRSRQHIRTTKELADIVLRALPHGYTRGRIHPATRTFQALRIAVNDELESLSVALDNCFDMLKVGGRLCVISFHSLEDRIVKYTFRRLGEEGKVLILTKKPVQPTDEECALNPRSRSAKLRAIQRKI